MDVTITDFPETRMAVVEHRGPAEYEYISVKKLIDWRIENGFSPQKHKSYGIHYDDPLTTPPQAYRVDFGVEVEEEVLPNAYGVINKFIPASRCAFVRYFGSRENVKAAAYLYNVWLPKSGEKAGDFPIFFHYVNIDADLREEDMITDVYLPLA